MTSDDDDDMTIALAYHHRLTLLRLIQRRRLMSRITRRRRGSLPGRRPNKARDFSSGLNAIMRDYFGVDGQEPVYDDVDFVRRFRVPRVVFWRIYNDIKHEPWWEQRPNATGLLQSHPLQKLVGAFRVLAYGESPDRTDEYVRLSKSTVSIAVKRLVAFILRKYQSEYLRAPTNDDLQRIMRRNAERGFPGCIGSLDCSHWEWRNCPTAHAGMYQDRSGKRTIVLETVCDEDMWIWHIYAGAPGSNNDLNVLAHSPLMRKVTQGVWPPRGLSFFVGGTLFRMPYYLVDGIYPRYALLVSPHALPANDQERTFNRLQEALRKDVERLYAVLTARFHVALYPARSMSVSYLVCIAKAIAILHNMVTAERRDRYV